MDERKLERSLKQLKKEISVNQDLKQSLRQSFVPQRSKRRFGLPAFLAAAAVACIALAVFWLASPEVIRKASAASLKIFNQVSFVELGGGTNLGAAEYNGTVYVPVVEKGLFAYSSKGFRQITDQAVNFVRVSPDGQRLAVSSGDALSILDLKTGQTEELLKGNNMDLFYEEPAWSPDGARLVYTKKTIAAANPDSHGFTEQTEIWEIDLNSKDRRQLAGGSYASYVKGTDDIIFERDQKIISRNLKDDSERVIDSGRFPSVSPDGAYVAYVKPTITKRNAAKNAAISESIEDVWIADTGEMDSKRKVTSNYVYKFVSEEDWLKNLPPSDIPQVLSFTGMYSYYDPSWTSDSSGLLVLKDRNTESGAGLRLMRIDFASEKLTAQDTIRRFVQALVRRDDDYAKSMMANPPEILTMSNPHPVGYEIISSGKEGEREYADVKISMAYTAQPDYSAASARYYLQPGENGYMITDTKGLPGNVTFLERAGTLHISKNGQEQSLFSAADLPAGALPQGKYRFGPLAYNEQTDTLVFSIQVLQDQGQKAAVNLLSYNLKDKKFELLDRISQVHQKINIGIMNLILDAHGKYAAVDLYSDDDQPFSGDVFVYSLNSGTPFDLSQSFSETDVTSVNTTYWDNETLVFSLNSQDQSMGYVFDPAEKSFKTL